MSTLLYDACRIHRSGTGWRGTYYDDGEPVFSLWRNEPLEIGLEAKKYLRRRLPAEIHAQATSFGGGR